MGRKDRCVTCGQPGHTSSSCTSAAAKYRTLPPAPKPKPKKKPEPPDDDDYADWFYPGGHIFLPQHRQSFLSNPPNTHLRVPKGEKIADYRNEDYRGYEERHAYVSGRYEELLNNKNWREIS